MFEKQMKKLDSLDFILSVFGAIALAYFAITVPSPQNNVIMSWVHSTHWGWFLAATLILVARPKIRAWF